MKRKVLFVLFITAIVLMLSCVSALALEGKSGPYSYSVKKNGDLCITHFDWDAYGDEDVYIPKMIDGYTVTEIGEYAFSEKDEKNYWSGVGKASVVIIPDTVVQIGEKAFLCTKITAMNIPAGVQSIGYGAFSGCENLKLFSVDKNNKRYTTIDGVLYDKNKKELLAFPGGKSADNFSIPQGIKSIAAYAFYSYGNPGISMSLPTSLTSIGDYAFAEATIERIIWEGAKKRIQTHYIDLPTSLNSIGRFSFASIKDGTATSDIFIYLDSTSISVIPQYAFFQNGSDHVYIESLPGKLERIEEYAFASSPRFGQKLHFSSLTFPNKVSYIGAYAFSKSLIEKGFHFGENSALKEIAEGAFFESEWEYSSDISLTLPKSLKTIGKQAFYNSKDTNSFKSLIIPNSVQEIGDDICNRANTSVEVESGSYAEFWATQNGYTITYADGDDISWLDD